MLSDSAANADPANIQENARARATNVKVEPGGNLKVTIGTRGWSLFGAANRQEGVFKERHLNREPPSESSRDRPVVLVVRHAARDDDDEYEDDSQLRNLGSIH